MHQLTQARQYNFVYAAACVFALFLGFLAGIAFIPDGMLRTDRIYFRTIATYFFHAGNVDESQLGSGWLTPDQQGTRSHGEKSVLLVTIDNDRKKDLELEFVLFPYFAKHHKTQTVRVTANNRQVGTWNMKAPTRRTLRSVTVKRSILDSGHPLRIGLEYAHTVTPAEARVAGGDERLAIRLSSLVVREQR